MNTIKHIDFFDATTCKHPIHIIGCGALGSHLAVMLTRLGFEELHLWDMDKVAEHNLTNQAYQHKDIGKKKVVALEKILKEINPRIKVNLNGEYKNANIGGVIFLLVDSIETRQQLVKTWEHNPNIVLVSDARMRLKDGQCYTYTWRNPKEREKLLASMQFTSDEAKEATPVAACGTTLSVTPTVWSIVSVLAANLINYLNNEEIANIVLLDAFTLTTNKF